MRRRGRVARKKGDLMQPPLGKLAYLYVGTAAFERDGAYYRDVLGAELVWAFHAFGAKVAAFRVCDGPLLLLADTAPPRVACPCSPSRTWTPRWRN